MKGNLRHPLNRRIWQWAWRVRNLFLSSRWRKSLMLQEANHFIHNLAKWDRLQICSVKDFKNRQRLWEKPIKWKVVSSNNIFIRDKKKFWKGTQGDRVKKEVKAHKRIILLYLMLRLNLICLLKNQVKEITQHSH